MRMRPSEWVVLRGAGSSGLSRTESPIPRAYTPFAFSQADRCRARQQFMA